MKPENKKVKSVARKEISGQDTIYICQVCNNKEKEFAIKGRITKICQKCGGWSVKSTLCDTLDYVNSPDIIYFTEYDPE